MPEFVNAMQYLGSNEIIKIERASKLMDLPNTMQTVERLLLVTGEDVLFVVYFIPN